MEVAELSTPSQIERSPLSNRAVTPLKSSTYPNNEPNSEPNSKDSLSCKPDCLKVLVKMNELLGAKYKPSAKTHIQNISARLTDGHSVEDLILVVEHKHKEWGNDPKMAQYLRPSTLFQLGKFQGYLTAAKTTPTGQHRNINEIGNDFSAPEGFTQMQFDNQGNLIS